MDFFKLIYQEIIRLWSFCACDQTFLELAIDLTCLLLSHQENWFQDNKSCINYDDDDMIAMAIMMMMMLRIMLIMIIMTAETMIIKSMMIKDDIIKGGNKFD